MILTCSDKVPALAPEASLQGSARSITVTSAPSRARNSAALKPVTPAPITAISVPDGEVRDPLAMEDDHSSSSQIRPR
jgi:hypothetical protein